MDIVITKLRNDLQKYVYGATESLILSEILLGILVLQYTFRMEPISIFEIITSVVSGLYLADLGTGLFHLYLDIYTGDEKTLKQLASAFQLHHNNTQIIQDLSIFDALRETSIVPMPILCILYNLTPLTSKSQILFQIVSLYAMHMSQITHKYAHKQTSEYKIITFLQEIRLILHPKNHHLHHITYDRDFCLVNGWANPLLNSIVHIPFIRSQLFPDIEK